MESNTSVANDIDAVRRELIRTSSQLSSSKDECEALERKVLRLESQHRAVTTELETLEDANRRLRREVDDQKRVIADLSGHKAELQSGRDELQLQYEDAMLTIQSLTEEIRKRDDHRQVAAGVIANTKEQNDNLHAQIAVLQERNKKHEDEKKKLIGELAAAQRKFELWKVLVAKEAENIANTTERCIAATSSLAEGGEDGDISAAGNIQSSINVQSLVTNKHQRDHSLTAVSNIHSQSVDLSMVTLVGHDDHVEQNSSTIGVAHVEVKPLFDSLYHVSKALRHFVLQVRQERRQSEDSLRATKANCQAADRELQQALTEQRAVGTRLLDAEMHVSRVNSQLEATKRALEEETSRFASLLASLAEVFHVAAEPSSIESCCRLHVTDVETLKARCHQLLEGNQSLKAELTRVRHESENAIAEVEERLKSQSQREVSAMQEKLHQAEEERRRAARDFQLTKEHLDATISSLQAEVDVVSNQYAQSLKIVQELEPAHRRLTRELPMMAEQLAKMERENKDLQAAQLRSETEYKLAIERIRSKLGPYEGCFSELDVDDTGDTPNTKRHCTLMELLLVTLRVLHGARKDLQDMSWQRRSLTRYVIEYERIFGPLSNQFVPNRQTRLVLKFRSAVVAVLALQRLKGYLTSKKHLRETVVSQRRGFGKVRLSAENCVFVQGTPPLLVRSTCGWAPQETIRWVQPRDFIVPSIDEAMDVPALIAILLEQVKAPVRSQPSAWGRISPPLMSHLRDSLQRIYLATGKRLARLDPSLAMTNSSVLASPLRGPSLVYPSQSSATALQQQQQLLRSALKPNSRLETTFGSNISPRRQANSSTLHDSTVLSEASSSYANPQQRRPVSMHHSWLPMHDPQRSGAQPPDGLRGGHPEEEFTMEVLNVIRALDNKVSGALRIHKR